MPKYSFNNDKERNFEAGSTIRIMIKSINRRLRRLVNLYFAWKKSGRAETFKSQLFNQNCRQTGINSFENKIVVGITTGE